MEKIYKTYKFYTEKGDRMAIFATEQDGILNIVEFKCSRKDQFCKEKARSAYYCYVNKIGTIPVYHPQFVNINIEPDKSGKDTFMQYCEENYFRIGFKAVRYLESTLYNKHKNTIVPIKKSSKIYNKILW